MRRRVPQPRSSDTDLVCGGVTVLRELRHPPRSPVNRERPRLPLFLGSAYELALPWTLEIC